MKKWIIKSGLLVILAIFTASLNSCEDFFLDDVDDDDETTDELYVKFINAENSQYTITSLEIRPRGPVMENNDPTENWSENILDEGQTIEPNGHTFFTLDIPAGNWSEYRVGVDDGNGNQIMLHNQPNYSGMIDLPITHWGGDTRTVEVTIVYNHDAEMIVVTGWSDFVGID